MDQPQLSKEAKQRPCLGAQLSWVSDLLMWESRGAKQHENSGLTLLPAQCLAHRTMVTTCCASQTGAGFLATVAAVTSFLPDG